MRAAPAPAAGSLVRRGGTVVYTHTRSTRVHTRACGYRHVLDLERTSRALQLHVTNLCTSVLLHTGSVCSVYAKFCFAVC